MRLICSIDVPNSLEMRGMEGRYMFPDSGLHPPYASEGDEGGGRGTYEKRPAVDTRRTIPHFSRDVNTE